MVTGTLFGGTLRRGQSVVIQPSGKTTRIRRIQSHGRDVETSGPGTRTALNLADVDALEGVHRGDVVTLAELGEPERDASTCCWRFPRGRSRSLKDGLRVRAHHGSGNVAAHVALVTGKETGRRRRARSRSCGSRRPAFVFAGDHFTVRDWSEQHTLAGAVVLDPDADRKAFRTPGAAAVARVVWRRRSRMPARLAAAYVARDGAARRSHLLLKSNVQRAGHRGAVARLASEGALVIGRGLRLPTLVAWQTLRRQAARRDRCRASCAPRSTWGLPLSDLRGALEPDLPFEELFDPLIAGFANGSSCASGRSSAARRIGPRCRSRFRRAGTKLSAGVGGQTARSSLAQGARTRCRCRSAPCAS